jgi:hypothetical protein
LAGRLTRARGPFFEDSRLVTPIEFILAAGLVIAAIIAACFIWNGSIGQL